MAMANDEPRDLEQLLARLRQICEDCGEISTGQMLEAVGRRSFGPLLLLTGIIPASPLSGVPGLPSFAAAIVLLIAMQMLLRGPHFWLPRWMLERSVSKRRLDKAIDFLEPVARFVDRLIRPRLTVLTGRAGTYLVAAMCVLIALTMPPLELIPFANTAGGAALATLGLGLIARDGLLILIALVVFGAGAGFGLHALFR